MYVVKRPYQNVIPYPYGRKPYVAGHVGGHAEPYCRLLLGGLTCWEMLGSGCRSAERLGAPSGLTMGPTLGLSLEYGKGAPLPPRSDLAGPVP